MRLDLDADWPKDNAAGLKGEEPPILMLLPSNGIRKPATAIRKPAAPIRKSAGPSRKQLGAMGFPGRRTLQ